MSRTLRVLLLVGTCLCCLAFPILLSQFRQSFRALHKIDKVLLLIIIIGVVLSTIVGLGARSDFVFGKPPEYYGLILWVCSLFLAIMFRLRIDELIKKRYVLYVFGFACLISLTSEYYYIARGYRVAGVMFHPTTLASFATITCLLAYHHIYSKTFHKYKTVIPYLVAFVAMAVVVISQSRIGYLLFAVTTGLWATLKFRFNRMVSVLLLMIIIGVAILPRIYVQYFLRFQSASVSRGITYRLDLYEASGRDLFINNAIYGNGADTIPRAINNTDAVSEEVAKSLNEGNIFVSTHDMFMDFAYFFGGISALALIILCARGFIHGIRSKNVLLVLIFLALIGNALVNVPSIELTPLFFIILFALLPSSLAHTTKST